MWLEIHHKPFEDGTPRHALISVWLSQEYQDAVYGGILNKMCNCESSGGFIFYEIIPQGLDHEGKDIFLKIMSNFGITGSIWVEYYIKVKM